VDRPARSRVETLFALEVESDQLHRLADWGRCDAESLHTSYALQHGYEELLGGIGQTRRQDLEALRDRPMLCGDQRDVLAARDSLGQLLGLRAVNS
jgi:hypothetical protein